MLYLDGKPVESREEEWGVQYASGEVFPCDDEADARIQASLMSAVAKRREIFVMEWEDA